MWHEEKTIGKAPARYGHIYCYAPIFAIQDYLKLGWVPTTALQHTHHGEHAVLMAWQCTNCEPIMPRYRYED